MNKKKQSAKPDNCPCGTYDTTTLTPKRNFLSCPSIRLDALFSIIFYCVLNFCHCNYPPGYVLLNIPEEQTMHATHTKGIPSLFPLYSRQLDLSFITYSILVIGMPPYYQVLLSMPDVQRRQKAHTKGVSSPLPLYSHANRTFFIMYSTLGTIYHPRMVFILLL